MKYGKRLAAILTTVFLLMGYSVVSVSAEEVIIKAEADTYTRSNQVDTVKNDDHFLEVFGNVFQNFVRFRAGSNPADIAEATLNFYYQANDTCTKAFKFVKLLGLDGNDRTSWEEDTLTYNIATSLGLVNTKQAENYGTGEVLIEDYQENDFSTGHWISFDVTDYVKKQTDGIYAFRFYGTNHARMSSHEISGQEPYLQILTGNTGKISSDLKKLTLPERIVGNCEVSLPTSVENGNGTAISWSADSPAVTVSDNKAVVSGLAANTTFTLTATGALNGETLSRQISVTTAEDPFYFYVGDECQETFGASYAVVFRTGIDIALPEGSNVFVATYDTDGRLINIRRFSRGQYQNGPVWLDWGQIDNVSRISAFAWGENLQPMYTRSILK